jgi:hypothetical protein
MLKKLLAGVLQKFYYTCMEYQRGISPEWLFCLNDRI